MVRSKFSRLQVVGLRAASCLRARWLGALALLLLSGASLPALAQQPIGGTRSTTFDSESADAPVDAEAAASEFFRELRTVEEEVGNLRERVFRSKATLQLLREMVALGAASGSRVALYHVNRLGNAYSMESAQYFLDGRNVYTKVDPGGSLDTLREFQVHDQAVPPGTHNVQVNLVLRGKGFGLFSYLRTYQFKVQSSYAFRVEEGRTTLVRVVTAAKGGLKNFVERPNIQYEARTDSSGEQ